ncbi:MULTISPECIES: biotin/lipoyl-binding protein [Xanthomonas]|uniref:biotin/lipoyl-binding protein n=1 Tax=Xanthomonas TaxID=338 RepID=UPI000E1E97FA|nr:MULTISPECIES: biotin/lipoyl-binding protein [Xanthomonas]
MTPTDTTASTHATASASKHGPRRFALPLVWCLLASGAIAAGWWWSTRAQPLDQALPITALSVTAITPRQVEWPRTLSATGIVAPWQEAVIGSQSDGLRLVSLNVAVGDVVTRGQPLARFDTATLLAAHAELRAGLAKVQAAAD